MKCTSFLVVAAIAVSAVNVAASTAPATGNLRGLQTIPSSINFDTLNKLPSPDALNNLSSTDALNKLKPTGEKFTRDQILKAVNDAAPNNTKVNASQLLAIAKLLLDKDPALAKADKATRDIADTLRKVVAKQFPGQAFDVALKSVVSKISSKSATRNLAGGSPLDSIGFANVNQLASFNGLRAGEQFFKTVNAAGTKVNADQLLSITKHMLDKDATLETADKDTRAVVDAVRKAIAKLYPGEAFDDALRRVVPNIPK